MRGDDPMQGMFTKLGGMIAGHLCSPPAKWRQPDQPTPE